MNESLLALQYSCGWGLAVAVIAYVGSLLCVMADNKRNREGQEGDQ